MRPHLLKFGGIGAYPGEVTVNFDDLNSKGLYLIVGPTGSGKTTIFDAMTYALYGKTASNRESMFVSDHLGRVDPYVEFTFSHQGRTFVAHREPPKEAKKQTVANKQWFRELHADGSEKSTETGATNVTRLVIDLIGLDADQFMQVILLPQGKFKDFLMARSSDRKPLLQKIFGTSLYERIAWNVKNSAAALREEANQIIIELNQHQSTAETIINSLSEESYSSEISELELADVVSKLEELIGQITNESDSLNEAYEKAFAAETQVKEQVERFDAAEEKKDLEKSQNKTKSDIDRAKSLLERHGRASGIVDLHLKHSDLVEQTDVSLKWATTLREKLNKHLSSLGISPDSTATILNAIPSASSVALNSEFSKLRQKVTDTLEAIDELVELRASIDDIDEALTEATKTLAGHEAELKTSSADLTKRKAELKATTDALKKMPALEKKISELDDLHEEADVDSAIAELNDASTALDKCQKAFERAENELSNARSQFTKHLAGELAADLSPDEPCPVCGSLEHPRKAKKTSEVSLDALEAKRDQTQSAKKDAETLVKECQKAVESAKVAKGKLPKAAEEKKLRNELAELRDMNDSHDELQDEVELLDEQVEQLKSDINEMKIDIRGKNTEIGGLKKRAEKLQTVARSLGAEKKVRSADEVLDDMEELLGDLEETDDNLKSLQAREKELSNQVSSALKKEKFQTAQEALDACLDDDQIENFEAEIAQFDERAERILILGGKIGSEPVPKVRPSIDALTEASRVAKEKAEQASASLTRTKSAKTTLQKTLKSIEKLGPQAQDKVTQAQEAETLAVVVFAGSGSGENRQLGLEEWVQRTLFEEVCIVATAQLLHLSNNRYALTLDADGAKTKRKAGGLELYVLDSGSGKSRSVHTLSGGEQFLTSLALALALAEVVERHAGGMELSSLFIDEGFGSLDGNTLDTAIDALLKLHDSGRTVGVITHVEAMQQQLDVGIRIQKTNTGSTLEVLVD